MQNSKMDSLLDNPQTETLFDDLVNDELKSHSSLLSETASSNPESASLLDESDTMSFVELNNDVMTEQEIEARKRYFMDPKNQAEILLQNYIKSQTILVNRHQRREIWKEFYRNAKKGKYRKLFSEQIYGISKEESQKKFKNLND